MNRHRKVLYRKIALWCSLPLLALLLTVWTVTSARESRATHTGTKDNSSFYYSSNPYASQETAASMPRNSKNVKKYTVCIRDGKISVFEEDRPEPLCTIDTPPSRLPEADRLLLEAGIPAETFEEACRMIEDYE